MSRLLQALGHKAVGVKGPQRVPAARQCLSSKHGQADELVAFVSGHCHASEDAWELL